MSLNPNPTKIISQHKLKKITLQLKKCQKNVLCQTIRKSEISFYTCFLVAAENAFLPEELDAKACMRGMANGSTWIRGRLTTTDGPGEGIEIPGRAGSRGGVVERAKVGLVSGNWGSGCDEELTVSKTEERYTGCRGW